jgi:hypothetical protein
LTSTVTSSTSQDMISAQLIRQALDKFLKAETVKSARIQVRTSDGVYHDIKNMKLLENRLFGARESHRIVIEVIPERAPMGRVIKDHGGIIL